MVTIYGSTIGSTFRAYLKYSIEETDTDFKITVNDFGIDLTSSTYIYDSDDYSDDAMKFTFKIGSRTSVKTASALGFTSDWSIASDYFDGYDKTLTVSKTAVEQTVTVSFSFYTKNWIRMNKNTLDGIGMSAATTTASATLTIPALAKPTVVLTALRDSKTDTTVTFTTTVTSFVNDYISSVLLTIDGSQYNIGFDTVGSSGVCTFNYTLSGISVNRSTASVVANGRGGASSIYACNIPAAFFTLSVGNKGKEIAFGQNAMTEQSKIPQNGVFSCGMSPIFYTMIGEIKMWAGSVIPDGWLLCDGSEVSKKSYPNLWGAIGNLWGTPASSSNFVLPNLCGNVPVGYNSDDTDFDTVGKIGGEKTHALSVSEMPSHTHIQNAHHHAGLRSGSVSGTQVKGGSNYCASGSRSALGSNSAATNVIYTVNTTPTNRNTGGGGAHNNLQPYAVIKYIICAI